MNPLLSQTATIIGRRILTKSMILVSLLTEKPLLYEVGQYIIVTPPNRTAPIKRLYSIAGSSGPGVVELLIQIVEDGLVSSFFQSAPLFSSVQVAGPAGLFRVKKTPLPKVFMVTGSGFAPIRSFLLSSSFSTQSSFLLWGGKTIDDVCLFDEILQLQKKNSSFSFCYCLSRETSLDTIPAHFRNYFRIGRIDAVWDLLLPTLKPTVNEYYLCGSRAVVESLRLFLLSRNISTEHIVFEKY